MSGQVQMTPPHAGPGYWEWAFQAENAVDVTGWGFWLAIIGLFLTLAGFALTFWQLAKTKSATNAAKDEVRRIRSSLAAYDAAHEASKAQYALKTTQRYLRNTLWAEVLYSYDDVRKSLMIIRSINSEEIKIYHQQIDIAMRYIKRLCERIEAESDQDNLIQNKQKTFTMIRQHDELLTNINITLQRSVI